jgi:hypothetical protein
MGKSGVVAELPFPQGEYSRLEAGGKGQNESGLGEFAVSLRFMIAFAPPLSEKWSVDRGIQA